MSPQTWVVVPMNAARVVVHGLSPEQRDDMIDCLSAELHQPDPDRTIAVSLNGMACSLTALSNGWVAVYRFDNSARSRRRFRKDGVVALYSLLPLSACGFGSPNQ